MKIEDEIEINKYGQGLVDVSVLLRHFEELSSSEKRDRLLDIAFLISQSKVKDNDVDQAIRLSNIKVTYTPCVMLRKGGVNNANINKILALPENELLKIFSLFISLFKIGYQRRFLLEKDTASKWWYWDLSQSNIEEKIRINLKIAI